MWRMTFGNGHWVTLENTETKDSYTFELRDVNDGESCEALLELLKTLNRKAGK